jgi:hypothetical protein
MVGMDREALARLSGWLTLTMLCSTTHGPPRLSRPAPISLPCVFKNFTETIPIGTILVVQARQAVARPRDVCHPGAR